jgi:Tol biopolymer transport system component
LFGGHSFIMDAITPRIEQMPHALPPMSDPNGWFSTWSWSPDGQKLAGWRGRTQHTHSGIVIYDLALQRYQQLTEFGSCPIWLNDNRRLLFYHDAGLHLVDSQSKQVRQVLSVAPQGAGRFSLSRDDRVIYLEVATNEADIWMMTMK